MAKKKNKPVRLRPYRWISNIGMWVFVVIFIYMSFSVYTYLQRDKIEFYEVVEGGIVNDTRHTGIIFREETTKYTEATGNINYYLREGKRAAVGTRVYSIDETGALSGLIAEQSDTSVALSSENLAELKKQLSSFSQTFTDEDFRNVYATKNELDTQVLELVSVDTLKNLDSMIAELGVNFVQSRADAAGVVSYAVDSMETLTPAQVTAASFDRSAYTKQSVRSGQLIESGKPAYKLITSEDWSVVFQLSEADQAQYGGKDSLTVRFIGRDLETSGAFSMFTGSDGEMYGKLDFSRYMEQFAADRFVDFEIVTDEIRGLKIPRSAVTEETFYLVPRDFLVTTAAGSPRGFYKETYSESGTSVVLVSCDIYNSDEDNYYIGMDSASELTAGDYIVKENSQDRYQIGMTATVQGVYNINRGYTAFRKIEILSSNDEYYTVKIGSDYGLSVYDHIVLDAAAVTGNGMVIYQ